MKDEEKWSLLHEYRRAVEFEMVPPVLCPNDGTELLPFSHINRDDPVLKCFDCKTIFTISSPMWEGILNNLAGIEVPMTGEE